MIATWLPRIHGIGCYALRPRSTKSLSKPRVLGSTLPEAEYVFAAGSVDADGDYDLVAGKVDPIRRGSGPS